MLLALAGCTSSDGNSGSAPAQPAQPSVTTAPALTSAPAPPRMNTPPTPGRPMTDGEKLQYQACNSGIRQDGCELYNDRALRLQGIDPGSAG
jgi:hypothetical protein